MEGGLNIPLEELNTYRRVSDARFQTDGLESYTTTATDWCPGYLALIFQREMNGDEDASGLFRDLGLLPNGGRMLCGEGYPFLTLGGDRRHFHALVVFQGWFDSPKGLHAGMFPLGQAEPRTHVFVVESQKEFESWHRLIRRGERTWGEPFLRSDKTVGLDGAPSGERFADGYQYWDTTWRQWFHWMEIYFLWKSHPRDAHLNFVLEQRRRSIMSRNG